MQHSIICSAKRTAVGSFQGSLASLDAPALGAVALEAAIKAARADAHGLDMVIMGCVLTGGMGQSPARQASLRAGFPPSVGVLTVNRVCSSGLAAVMIADWMIRAGDARCVAAGGMESMTNAPYCVPGARKGLRLGDATIVDTMVHDGLWDAPTNQHMGSCAELCAHKYGFTREAQDAYARASYERAQAAIRSGVLADQIASVTLTDKKGATSLFEIDEEPMRADFEKMKKLKPSFKEGGTVTAANASSISDGAAALVVASEEHARDSKMEMLSRIVAHGGFSQEPEWFTTSPIGAIKAVLAKAGMTARDIDLWEINEAFSCVPMAAMKELGLDQERVNVHGGAVALGHPIGCSGARILVSLVHAMRERKAARGMAAICNGGGEATAMIIEAV